jgi:hypothetical protein
VCAQTKINVCGFLCACAHALLRALFGAYERASPGGKEREWIVWPPPLFSTCVFSLFSCFVLIFSASCVERTEAWEVCVCGLGESVFASGERGQQCGRIGSFLRILTRMDSKRVENRDRGHVADCPEKRGQLILLLRNDQSARRAVSQQHRNPFQRLDKLNLWAAQETTMKNYSSRHLHNAAGVGNGRWQQATAHSLQRPTAGAMRLVPRPGTAILARLLTSPKWQRGKAIDDG